MEQIGAIRIVRAELVGIVDIAYRLIGLAGPAAGECPLAVKADISRVEPDRLVEVGDGEGVVPFVFMGIGQARRAFTFSGAARITTERSTIALSHSVKIA